MKANSHVTNAKSEANGPLITTHYFVSSIVIWETCIVEINENQRFKPKTCCIMQPELISLIYFILIELRNEFFDPIG